MVFEPWLEAVAEAGIQLEIPRHGEPVLLGVVPQIVDRQGVYRGSRFGAPEDRTGWEPAVAVANEVARRVQAEGYFGPLAIDAMLHRDGESLRVRPLQDLNARWSMGRLALGLSRFAFQGHCAAWLHFSVREPLSNFDDWLASRLAKFPPGTAAYRVALPPAARESSMRRATVLLTAPDAGSRAAAEHQLRTVIGPEQAVLDKVEAS
jgi:hypothetical protein